MGIREDYSPEVGEGKISEKLPESLLHLPNAERSLCPSAAEDCVIAKLEGISMLTYTSDEADVKLFLPQRLVTCPWQGTYFS